MDRRAFLRNSGFWTASVALGGLGGCGGGDDPAPAPPPPPVDSPAPAAGAGWKFPQSIASGDPRADGVMLWTRVVPLAADDVLTAGNAGDFSIRLIVTAADNATLLGSNQVLQGTLAVDNRIPVLARWDNTVRNKVSGLAPATTYYYQFIAGEVRSRVGRFRTAPAADADLAELRFAFMTCQDWSVNHWGAFDEISRNENIDLVVHLGDYIYETVGEAFQSGAVEDRHDALVLPDGTFKSGSGGPKYASSLADYRYLYKKYRTDARLQAVHERFAFVATWDDHEFSDDCWGDAETYDNGFYDAATGQAGNTEQPQRRRSANQAWFEFMPADVAFDDSVAGYATIRIYRELRFGKLAHFVVTDERLYRSDHIIPEAAPNPATGAALGSVGARYFVPAPTRDALEAQKILAAPASDPLARVSILGSTQRQWWKDTVKNSPATWKLWCNEVSLLRMGLDGTQAVATLLALNAVSTLATNIGTAAASTGGNIPAAGAVVAAMTAGASQAIAGAGATAIATALATSADPLTAAVGAGLSAAQAGIAVAAFNAAAAASGATAQASAAAQVIAFGYIKPDIVAKGAASAFVVASGQAATLAPFFARYLLNCDQWDGYNAERKNLMAHLKDNAIQNVVALTGDLHSFHAGAVSDDFDASGGGTPVMVDLVTAGISSDSFFSYFADATNGSALSNLVFYPLNVPVTGLGTLALHFNLFDFTIARSAPTLDQLAEQTRVQLRGALAAKGVPAASLDATTDAVLAGLKADPAFATQLLALAGQLAGLHSNPWIRHINTDAQGYAVVTLTPGAMQCSFRELNRLEAGKAPATTLARTVKLQVTAGTAAVNLLA
ncbi:alkaline phosphatase D family protein [Niveibacterium sp. SC-1]|uniref:alkaline phosphatase D family protein n=1 Tax=Niveibacterium sp. SC-1 TaxID=3135646 RepID=UPI00312046BB